MTKLLKSHLALCLLLLISLSATTVMAGGEVTSPAPSTLRMSIDDEIRQLNASLIVYDEETNTTPIQLWETDDEVGIELYAQNQKFHRITITEAIDNKRRPVYLCYNNYMINYAYNQVNISFCENYKYATMLREIRQGQSINFEIPPIINGSNAWSVWVGKGAGGGGGIPLCEGIIANWNKIRDPVNMSKGDWGSDYGYYSVSFGWVGSTYVGCNPQYWEAQDKRPQGVLWRHFPMDTGNTLDYFTNETNSTINEWYSTCSASFSGFGSSFNCLFVPFTINDTCAANYTYSTRARVCGTVQSNYVCSNSLVKTFTANNPEYLGDAVCFPEEEQIVLPPDNKEDFNPLFLFFFPAVGLMVFAAKKKSPPAE